jgi:threonine synthase
MTALLSPARTNALECSVCAWSASADPALWRCPACGAVVDFASAGEPSLGLGLERDGGEGFVRYAAWLGLAQPISLGEPVTPLVTLAAAGGAEIKNEALLPTGSFKDRGAAALISWLAARGVAEVVLDSSGNAGAAIAAYAARAGIACEVHVPATTSQAKVAQARAYGARVLRQPGPRAASTVTAQQAAASRRLVYASQIWHPAFVLGVETLAFELWEQRDPLPESIVMPVGAGTLLLGVARGFDRLLGAGLIERVPRLIGVQSASCTSIAIRFGAAAPEHPPARSIAEGIQVADPPRAGQIVAALTRSGGTALVVGDDLIAAKVSALGREGLLVEPTAAVALAGLDRARDLGVVRPGERIVAIVTGSGLKTVVDA